MLSSNPAVQGLSMQFARAGGLSCHRITMAGCSTKICAQQARVLVSKVEEPEEEEEKRSEVVKVRVKAEFVSYRLPPRGSSPSPRQSSAPRPIYPGHGLKKQRKKL